jgi:hypothetical protein
VRVPRTAALLAVLAPALAGAQGARVSGLEITGFGILSYEFVSHGRDETSGAGAVRTIAREVRLEIETDRVPIRPDLAYGVRYVVRGSPHGALVDIKLIRKYSRPCRRPDGSEVHELDSVWKVRIGEVAFNGERFPLPGEERSCLNDAEPGTMLIELHHGGRKLGEKRFFLYRPGG